MSKGNGLKIDESWAVENDLRTLCDAKEIQKDSKRMAAVKKLAKEKMMDMAGVASDDEGDE